MDYLWKVGRYVKSANALEQTSTQKRKKRSGSSIRDDIELTLLAVPTTVWYLIFCYLPMFGLVLAFKDYRIVDATKGFIYNLIQSDWTLTGNFEFFLKSSQFGIVLRNTLLYNIVFIILNIVIPVSLAILINQLYSKRKSKTYQTMMFMPHFMSWVVVSYFVFAFLSYDKGLLNSVLEAFGKDPINWYTEAKYWPFILVFMQVWKTVGYNMVVYLASISGIDTSLYEAGALDGASKFQQAIHITLPALKPVIIMMFILSVGRIFSTDFGLFYQIPRGVTNSLYEATMTFDVYIYNMLLTPNVPIGRTAAAGFFQSVIGCITILVANAIVRKVDRQSAII